MTLEEAIKHAEEVVETQEGDFRVCPYSSAECDGLTHCKALQYGHNKGCLKFASDHRQLAEWLRELKIHREIHDVLLQLLVDFDLDICCDDLMDNEEEQKICEENCDNKTKGCWVRWAKLKVREVNADE